MTFSAIFTVFTLLLIPSLFANEVGGELKGCKNSFHEEEIYDAFDCSNTDESTLNNLTKHYDKRMLELITATTYTDEYIDTEFTIKCCFYAQPYCPRIKWYKNGEEIQEGQLNIKKLEGGRTLKVYATPSSGGNWTCVATTPFGEHSSFQNIVKMHRACEGRPTVVKEPSTDVVKVKKGSRQKLVLNYICFGTLSIASVICRIRGWLVVTDGYYNTSLVRSGRNNRPTLTYTIVISNFSRTENITCRLNNRRASPTTFVLVEQECEDSPYIVPKKGGVIALNYGANYTMKCSVYCLRKQNLNDPVWRDGRDRVIKIGNHSKYRLHEDDLTRGGYAPVSAPSYETSLTVINFTKSENFSCYVSENDRTGTMFSLVLTLTDTEAGQRPIVDIAESFFKRTGMWIVLGGVTIILSVAIIVLFIRYRKKIAQRTLILYRPKEKDVAARYDAFISYSEADGGSFVRSTLKPMLENECGYTLSLHYREFVPGTTIIDNIIENIYDSRRILTVITPKFLESEWCRFEIDHGLRSVIEKPNALVVIMLHEMPLDQLPQTLRSFLSKVTFLPWNDSKKDEMRKKLKSALGPPNTIDNPDGCTTESDVVRENGGWSDNTALNEFV